jgi:radical SAM superfamily enzyme YgiQ (UPF0313 family)
MKKILLVYPEVPTTYWSFDHALPFVDKKAAIPPLGLMTVAAMLPADYELRLIDLNVQDLARSDIEQADLVFLSAMIVQKQSFDEVVQLCRQLGKPVVAGGPYPISMHEQIEGVDHFVLDEAEVTLPRFLQDLSEGHPQRLYRDTEKPDLTSTPAPRFDLIDVRAYDSMALQYSRGCPYNCEFCDIIEMFGRRQRVKAPGQFLREMEAVEAAGFRGPLFIVDDNFIGNRGKTKELLRAVAAWQQQHGFPFTLSTEASIDLAQDDELLHLLVAAGFDMVFVGIETPDEQTLAFTQKSQNLKAGILESVRKIQDHGIEVTGGFIVGFDTDPPDIFDRQIAFVQEAGIPMAMVGLLTALPNTQLARRLRAEGRLLHDSTGNNTHTLRLNFVPHMPEDQLIDGYKRVLRTLYSPRNYFRRCSTLLRRLPPHAKTVRAVTWQGIKALLRSIARQAFSPYGFHYLRMLAETAVARPRLFPDAVALAIKGYHVFVLTTEILKADAFARKLLDTRETYQQKVSRALHLGGGRLAAALERSIRRLLDQTRKRNARFSLEVQQHLRDSMEEFARTCGLWLSRLQLVRVRSD